jgi:hypothetical protein
MRSRRVAALGKEDDPDRLTHLERNMSDYRTATGHDSEIVEIAEGNQIRYWCHSLQCTEAQLRQSVRRWDTHLPQSDNF